MDEIFNHVGKFEDLPIDVALSLLAAIDVLCDETNNTEPYLAAGRLNATLRVPLIVEMDDGTEVSTDMPFDMFTELVTFVEGERRNL